MLLRTEEAAKFLDVQKSTMEAWRCRGGGPVFVRYKRAIRYREDDLRDFVLQNLLRSTSDVRGKVREIGG